MRSRKSKNIADVNVFDGDVYRVRENRRSKDGGYSAIAYRAGAEWMNLGRLHQID
jgi:hypothetical protein